MSLLIGADLVPTRVNFQLFSEGKAHVLIGEELKEIFDSVDFKIFNLEIPLCDVSSPIEKCGPALSAPIDTIAGYKAIGVDLLTLANNHIMDQGKSGFLSTLKTLNAHGICRVGAGENLEEAMKPFVLEKEGKKIGIYACAEHEFSIADENTPGANPFDPLETPDHISELKAVCDYVIVLYHGGKEHYRYPSPMLQKHCRKMIKKGADLVLCQHSHCVGCEEKYHAGTIVYGQGNFLFSYRDSEFWKTSLLVKINDDFSIEYIPLVSQESGVRIAKDEEIEAILGGFFARSEEIKDPEKLKKHYDEISKKELETYLVILGSVNKNGFLFRAMNKLTRHKFLKWWLKRKFRKDQLIKIQNAIECEAHRELLLNGLKNN